MKSYTIIIDDEQRALILEALQGNFRSVGSSRAKRSELVEAFVHLPDSEEDAPDETHDLREITL